MFKFFGKNKNDNQRGNKINTPALQLYNSFENALNLSYTENNPRLKENENWLEILEQPQEIKEAIGLIALKKLVGGGDYNYGVVRRKVFKTFFNSKNPPSKESLIEVFNICSSKMQSYYSLPPKDIVFCFQYYKEHYGKDDAYTRGCDGLFNTYEESYQNATLKKIIIPLGKLDHDANDQTIYDRRDVLGKHLDSQWENYDAAFKAILVHCWEPGQKAKPTAKWTKTLKGLDAKHKDQDAHIGFITDILELQILAAKEEVKWMNSLSDGALWTSRDDRYLHESNEIALSYFIWYAAMKDHPVINTLIGQLALSSYNKIRGLGCLSTKNGNACMYAFTLMSPKAGITQLLNIRNKTRNKGIKNTANKQLARKAEEMGISEDTLLELSVPEFNLKGNLSTWEIGNYTGVIDISLMKNSINYWINNQTEKQQKSIPKEVKELHKEELKAFKSTIKDIKTTVSVHAKRLENAYLDNIEWSLADWKRNYVDHPFLSRYSSILIWLFDESLTGIMKEGQMVSSDGKAIRLDDYKSVKLWHPIYGDIEAVTNWRNYILNEEIRQPFKQAYREIYIVTDAEITTNTYSNRFAAHILYQHQFSALAKTRDWSYMLQGAFDSHNTPSRSIPKYQLKAEFWLEPIEGETTPAGMFTYVASDQVRIYSGTEMLDMADVPKIVFSEIMRDVDLFVGVTSIGNNPEWEDVGERRNYWQSYSFGDLNETAKTRKDVLERILPKLKIADRCSLSDKFLTVQGKIRNYKIHLGSGNILMTPNDQYLCIVPNSRDAKTKIFLPFDNDRTLSIIISKAFLLYDDDKITDKTILRQIKI